MLTAFYDEEIVSVGDVTLRLAIDFRAIDVIEHIAGEDGTITPMPNVVAMLHMDPPPLSVCGKVLWALLRRHHEEMSLDETAGVMFSEHANRVGMAMYGLIVRAMNLGEPKAKDKNPRKRRGASATS
jgi:hypothetical protein